MFVIRPKGIYGTPHDVAVQLGVQTRFYPNLKRPDRRFDYRRDFFMTNVSPTQVNNGTENFVTAHQFFSKNKLGQRQALAGYGIPVPNATGSTDGAGGLSGDKFVVRPLRHSRGEGYRIATEKLDFQPGVEYISEAYPKKREYRVIFVFGKPLIWLRKKPNEGVTQDAPWGHVNSFFQTINDVPACRLSGTDCVNRLADCPVVKGVHITAADVLYNKSAEKPYVVLELNLCPSLAIDNNRDKVVEAIRERH